MFDVAGIRLSFGVRENLIAEGLGFDPMHPGYRHADIQSTILLPMAARTKVVFGDQVGGGGTVVSRWTYFKRDLTRTYTLRFDWCN